MSLLDWSRGFHGFRHLDGRECDWRNAHPGTPRGSIQAWRTFPAIAREKRRSFIAGFVVAMVVYGIASTVLVLAFTCLGFRP